MQSRVPSRCRGGHATRVSWLAIGACAWGCATTSGGGQPDRREPKIEPPLGIVVERACTPTGPELCFNATDDNCNGIIDEGCGLNSGLLQFAIAWLEPKADVDLFVTDPNGVLIEVGRVAGSGLVKERDCPGRNDECHGQNSENVYLTDGDPVRGRYRVRVRLEKLGGENPPIKVRLGARVGPKTFGLELSLDKPEQEHEVLLSL